MFPLVHIDFYYSSRLLSLFFSDYNNRPVININKSSKPWLMGVCHPHLLITITSEKATVLENRRVRIKGMAENLKISYGPT